MSATPETAIRGILDDVPDLHQELPPRGHRAARAVVTRGDIIARKDDRTTTPIGRSRACSRMPTCGGLRIGVLGDRTPRW
jgi:hypothetical protein